MTWNNIDANNIIDYGGEDDFWVIVAIQAMTGLKINSEGNFEKQYDESKLFYVPYELVMFEREPEHFLSVDKSV